MSDDARSGRLEARLATLLSRGTWLSCALIGLGMMIEALGPAPGWSAGCFRTGIALLILLPIARVAVMEAWFIRTRDVAFAITAAIVLIVIALSALLGIGGA